MFGLTRRKPNIHSTIISLEPMIYHEVRDLLNHCYE